MALAQRFREVPRNYFTPDTKKFIFWLLGIGAFVGFIWIGDIFPKIRAAGWSAIEYAVVAYSILAARGFGYAIYDQLKEGALKALGFALSGFIIVAFIFYFLSVCIKPGFPLYLISSPRGQGAFIVILCSATYGFLSARRQAAPKDAEGLTQAEEAELKQIESTPMNQLTGSQNARWTVLNPKREQAKARASERNWIIGLVIAALVCFYFSIDAGMRDYKRFNQATGVAQGKVVELREESDEGGPSRYADYKFKVNGVDYEGWVGNWDESLSKDDPVQVYYNPGNPDFNHAKGDAPSDGFFNKWTFFGILCLIGVFWVVREQRKKSHSGWV